MSLKIVALIIFVVGITLLLAFLIYENSRRQKEEEKLLIKSKADPQSKTSKAKAPIKVASVHDFFEEDLLQPSHEQLNTGTTQISDNACEVKVKEEALSADIPVSLKGDEFCLDTLSECPVHTFFMTSTINDFYAQLENTLSGDYRISPLISVTNLIGTRGSGHEIKLEKMSFDFLLSDLDTGEVRCVVMTGSTLNSSPLWTFIVQHLEARSIPVYCHYSSDTLSDDELSGRIYNKIEGIPNE